MRIVLEIDNDTARALQTLAFITGRMVADIAATELVGTLLLPAQNPDELLGLALEVYAESPEDRAKIAERFRWHCRAAGIPMPEYAIDAALAEANGEVDRGQGKLIAEAGRILSGGDAE